MSSKRRIKRYRAHEVAALLQVDDDIKTDDVTTSMDLSGESSSYSDIVHYSLTVVIRTPECADSTRFAYSHSGRDLAISRGP